MALNPPACHDHKAPTRIKVLRPAVRVLGDPRHSKHQAPARVSVNSGKLDPGADSPPDIPILSKCIKSRPKSDAWDALAPKSGAQDLQARRRVFLEGKVGVKVHEVPEILRAPTLKTALGRSDDGARAGGVSSQAGDGTRGEGGGVVGDLENDKPAQ
ncbi:hypothetical protein FRC09_000257, partial [Ceratobasidium sp. 395]